MFASVASPSIAASTAWEAAVSRCRSGIVVPRASACYGVAIINSQRISSPHRRANKINVNIHVRYLESCRGVTRIAGLTALRRTQTCLCLSAPVSPPTSRS